ncbi:sodium channel protein para [Trichonephila clavipes]|nr:sodium channel protein para [Trichonephila clavipes]
MSFLPVLNIKLRKVFAGITLVEVTLKMIAYSPKEYFRSKWNAFDCLVLIIAGTELTLLDVEHPILFTLRAYKLIINLFLGIVFYTFFYKSLPRNAASEDKLHSAIQVILNRQVTVSDTITSGKQSKSDNSHQNDSSASDTVSETQDNSTKIFKKNKKKQLHNQREMEIMEDSSSEYMDDCCPSLCYFCCSFCKADENPVLWQNWADIRCRLYWFVETKCFRVTISLIIIFSVAMLVCEQSHKSRYPEIAFIIKILSPVIFMLFFFEMVLKWMAYGLQKFFKSHLGRFEFFILVPLPMKRNSCLAGSESVSNESLLHLRQFECNRFLGRHCRYRPTGSGEIFQMDWNAPEIQSADLSESRMRRIELGCTADYRDRNPTIMAQDCLPAILTSLKRALPSHFLVFFFVFYMWLIFAVMGTAMFSGMLHRCLDINNQVLALSETACLQNNGTYKTSPVNFDSVAHAFIGLLQVVSLIACGCGSLAAKVTDSWPACHEFEPSAPEDLPCMEVMHIKSVDSSNVLPLVHTFLTLNLFVGVTCWYFNDQKRDSDNNLNSRTNALYKAAVRKMENVKLEKTIPPPKLHFQAFVYRMVSSDNFEMASFVFIGLHMLLIALDMYDPDPSEMFALAMFELNIFFIVIFSIEAILKLIAYRQYYFLSFWNHFDVIVLTLCICGTLFENLFSSPMLPAMLRLVRFIKCRRYLRRYIRGMLPLLYTLYSSIPAFVSIVIIQFIIMFIYATFGVYLFHNIKQSWDISGELSFETFPKAMLLLFQLSTLAGWIDVLHCLSASGENLTSATFFVVSYIIIVYYIIIKTHLVVILDSFETAMWEYENILLKEDYEMFAEVWQKFDNNARGIIKFSNLPDLLDVLEEPFHFCKPNRYLIATLNIPIYEGDLVFYADVMDALTRDFMSHKAHLVEIPDSIPGLLDTKGKTLKKIGSTLWRQRQNHCAYVIQRAWRRYTGKLVRSPVFYSEVRLADQGDKVDTYLAAEVRSGSHASV